MAWLLSALAPNFEAALRDVRAAGAEARQAAATRLASADDGRQPEAIGGLLTLARDRDARVRCAAVHSLSEFDASEAVDEIIAALEDPHELVREVAVVAVSTARRADAMAALRRCLRSEHPEVRFQAVVCCAEQGQEDWGDDLRRLMSDRDGRVRANAARALGLLACPDDMDLLGDALQDESRLVRREAAIALAGLGDDRGADELSSAIDDPELALEALDLIGRLGAGRCAERVAVIAQSFLRPRIVKAAAARALIRIGDDRGVPALRQVLTGWRSEGRQYAAEIAAELRLVELAPDLRKLAAKTGPVAEAAGQALTAIESHASA